MAISPYAVARSLPQRALRALLENPLANHETPKIVGQRVADVNEPPHIFLSKNEHNSLALVASGYPSRHDR